MSVHRLLASFSLIGLLLSLQSLAITGCFSALGSGIKREDCMRVAAQQPLSRFNVRTDVAINFIRCNGQSSYYDPSFAFSMPQGSAFGSCAVGLDLLSRGSSATSQVRPATWDHLESEMSGLVKRCVDDGGGLGGNHTWGGFVFVVTNPTQVDTAHTCLALPGPEDDLDLGQCMARRAEIAANVPPGGSVVAMDQGPGPSAPNSEALPGGAGLAGHKKGGAWMQYQQGERSSTGYWTLLRSGMNTYPLNSHRPPYVFDGKQWQAFNGPVVPISGAVIRVPDHLLPVAQHNVIVWHADIWIPVLDSTTAHPSQWWVFVANQWVPLSPSLIDAANWVLRLGAWRVVAGSWFYTPSVSRDSVQGSSYTSSWDATGSSHTLVSPIPMRLAQPQSVTISPSLPQSSESSNPMADEFLRLQGIGHGYLTRYAQLQSTTTLPSLLQPTETSNPMLDELRMMQGIAYFDFLTRWAQPRSTTISPSRTQSSGTSNPTLDEFEALWRMGYFDFLTGEPDRSDSRAEKRPRTTM